jgi:hypothetical protein
MYHVHPALLQQLASDRVEEMRRSAELARRRKALKRQRHRQRH